MSPRHNALPEEAFLSHSSRDRSFADKLVRVLRAHGVPVWHSSTNIVGAKQWHDEIGKALARCDWFVLVLSPHSVTSKWVKRELLYALNDPRYESRMVPLLYKQLRVLLGIAKLLGALVLVVPGIARVKEWAYAGFAFAWIAAFVAHYLVKDGPKAFIPLILLVLLVISYVIRPASHQWQAKVTIT